MNDKKIFELTGINVIEKIEFEAKEEIVDNVANILASEFEQINYREIKTKLLETPMYIADVPNQYYGVVFFDEKYYIYIFKKNFIFLFWENVIK